MKMAKTRNIKLLFIFLVFAIFVGSLANFAMADSSETDNGDDSDYECVEGNEAELSNNQNLQANDVQTNNNNDQNSQTNSNNQENNNNQNNNQTNNNNNNQGSNNNNNNQAQSGYTISDVQQHNTQSSCWVIVSSKVYDMTPLIGAHPNVFACGQDNTQLYTAQHGSSTTRLVPYYKGELVTGNNNNSGNNNNQTNNNNNQNNDALNSYYVGRFNGIDSKISSIESKLSDLNSQFDDYKEVQIALLESKIKILEARLENIEDGSATATEMKEQSSPNRVASRNGLNAVDLSAYAIKNFEAPSTVSLSDAANGQPTGFLKSGEAAKEHIFVRLLKWVGIIRR